MHEISFPIVDHQHIVVCVLSAEAARMTAATERSRYFLICHYALRSFVFSCSEGEGDTHPSTLIVMSSSKQIGSTTNTSLPPIVRTGTSQRHRLLSLRIRSESDLTVRFH